MCGVSRCGVVHTLCVGSWCGAERTKEESKGHCQVGGVYSMQPQPLWLPAARRGLQHDIVDAKEGMTGRALCHCKLVEDATVDSLVAEGEWG